VLCCGVQCAVCSVQCAVLIRSVKMGAEAEAETRAGWRRSFHGPNAGVERSQ
jgi:hypothetical protein